jgi:single-strand DNA-binding protein
MNRITLIGNLTKDPEIRTTPNGNTVCTFTIAVNRKKVSEPQTDFFRINAWGKLGELCGRFLGKGRKVAVIGELQARTYESNGKTMLSLDVVADEVEFLSPKDEKPETKPQKPSKTAQPDEPDFSDIDTGDLPF